MAVNIFIEHEGRVVQIPVNPADITVTAQGDNETVTSISLGEINKLSNQKLKEVTFESFFEHDSSKGYVIGKNRGSSPSFFVSFFETIMNSKKPCRFIVSGCNVNFLASVENFERRTTAALEQDIYYSVTVKEYKNFKAKFVELKEEKQEETPQNAEPVVEAVTPKETQEESTNKQPTVGCTVVVNGRLHRDSGGAAPGQTESNATRTINFINPGSPYPYHVTTSDGGWRGWVSADAVEVQ